MDKIRVLQINKLYYPVIGGVERVVRQIAEGLNDRTEMRVLVCREKGKSVGETVNGVKVLRAGSFGVFFSMPLSLSFFHHFNKLKKESDIIHIHMPFPLADIAVSCFGYKGKVILWWHSDIVRQKKVMLLVKPFMMRLLKRADKIMVATESHIDNSAYLGEFRNKCVVIPFGIKIDDRDQDQDQDQDRRMNDDVNDSDRQVRVLFAGRLVHYKGCDVLLKAFTKVSGAVLTIAGTGPLEEDLRKQARELGISGRVHFTGSISDEDMGKAFDQCELFVLPSVTKNEAFGLVQIEAMSRGKPVINTNLPSGVPTVSLDRQTGITVEPYDAEGLAEAINSLVGDRELRLKYGQAARDRAEAVFSEEKMLERILAEYEGILS